MLIGNKKPFMLVDSSSTNNFLQPWLAKHLNLVLLQTTSFKVMVGDRNKINCEGKYVDVPMEI